MERDDAVSLSFCSSFNADAAAVRACCHWQVPPLTGDRFLAPDIASVTDLVRSGAIARIAHDAMDAHYGTGAADAEENR